MQSTLYALLHILYKYIERDRDTYLDTLLHNVTDTPLSSGIPNRQPNQSNVRPSPSLPQHTPESSSESSLCIPSLLPQRASKPFLCHCAPDTGASQ